jgi:uncharacterized protein (TIGR03382 family)
MLLLALSLPITSAATLSVDPADGAAYATVQAAVTAASSGDTITIAAGTYAECVDTGGKDLALVGLYGSGATTIDGSHLCTTVAAITVDGGEDVSVTGVTVLNATFRSFKLLNSTLELDDVVVDGNTNSGSTGLGVYAQTSTLSITDSTFTNLSGGYYAVIYASDTDVTITDSTFSGNHAYYYAGVMYFYARGAHTLTIDGATFEDNESQVDWAGAINVWGYSTTDADTTTVSITNSTFTGNSTNSPDEDGGALYITSVDELDISDNTFTDNLSYDSGGAIYMNSNDVVTLSGNLFCGNTSWHGPGGAVFSFYNVSEAWSRNLFVENESLYTDGGAIGLSHAAAASIENNTFVGNTCVDATEDGSTMWAASSTLDFRNNIVAYSTGGGAVYLNDAATDTASTFAYNDFYTNTPSDSSGFATFSTSTSGNLTDDPGLADYTLDGDCDNDDLTLASWSTLIDAGDPATLDPDGSVADIGAYGGGTSVRVDGDGDGSYLGRDCDDTDPGVYPGALETCDGIDDDCDGTVDEAGSIGEDTWYADADADGYGDAGSARAACDAPTGYGRDATDCDDTDATAYPGAAETAYDGIDQDCDGADVVDVDADGYTSTAVSGGDDCDDGDAAIHPGAADSWYDGIDSDCAADDDDDQDADGFGLADDCDDTDAGVYPGASDTWYDGIDSDCAANDDDDQDADGYALADDCDDTDAGVYPGAPDQWYDDVDSDCAGNDDQDQDADGYALADDCDDTDAGVFPGASDTWYDDVDSDCAGNDDQDQDADGHALADDCDDTDATVYPGAPDDWYDGTDSDCAGDDDDDQDADGSDVVADCDDADAELFPGAIDIPGDGIDQDCDGADAVEDEPEPEPAGCGCDSGHPAPTYLPAALGLLLLVRRRRARG